MKKLLGVLVGVMLSLVVLPSWAETESGQPSHTLSILNILNGRTEKSERDVSSLQQELTSLKISIGKSGPSYDTSTIARIDALEKAVATLQARDNGNLSAGILTLTQEVATLKQRMSTQKNLEQEIEALTTRQTETSRQVASLENGGGSMLWYLLFGALVVIVLVLFFVGKRRLNDVEQVASEAKTLAGGLDSSVTTAINVANRALGEAERATISAKRTAQSLSEITTFVGFRKIVFPIDFEARVSLLSEHNKTYRFTVCFEDTPDTAIHLVVEWKHAGVVTVRGIKSQTNDINTENLKGVIGRAGKTAPDGTHRLTGVVVDTI